MRETKPQKTKIRVATYRKGQEPRKENAKRQMEVVDRLRTDLAMMTEEDVFIYGFRMGARMILDVVGDYKGQFYDAGEVGQ